MKRKSETDPNNKTFHLEWSIQKNKMESWPDHRLTGHFRRAIPPKKQAPVESSSSEESSSEEDPPPKQQPKQSTPQKPPPSNNVSGPSSRRRPLPRVFFGCS